MFRRFLAALAAGSILFAGGAARADSPANGLGGLAYDPAGGRILAAGDSRAIYVLDADTLTVTDRRYIGTTAVWMELSLDSKVLFLRDTGGRLVALDAASFEELWSVDRTDAAAYARAANQIVYTTRKSRETHLVVADGASFAESASINLGDFRTVGLGVSIDGLRAVAVSRSDERKDEEKKRPENSVKGLERAIFRQRHDQRGATIAEVDLITGTPAMTESWYKADNIRELIVSPTEAFVLTFTEDVARIARGGEVEMIDSGARNHYGAAMSRGMDALVTGSMRAVTIKPLAADAAQVMKLDTLPGWPEYVIRFAHGPEGLIYAATTAYRVLAIDPVAGTVEAAPVY